MLTAWNASPLVFLFLFEVTRIDYVDDTASARVEADPSQVPSSPSFGGEETDHVENSATPSALVLNDSVWEMDQRPNILRSYRFLEINSARAGVKNIQGSMWHRLPVLGESASESQDGFGAWSWAHISCGAHLPLRTYFAQF